MTHPSNNRKPKRQSLIAQSLPEYIFIALLLGGLGMVGVVGFNGGIQTVFNQLRAQLLAGGAVSSVTNQTNQTIATAQQAASLPTLSPEPTLESEGPSQPLPSPELQSLSTLLTSMDPTNLPEVSGANSTVDIAQLVSSANTLIEQSKALESANKDSSGLNVSELVFQAKKLALTQYSLAADELGGSGRNQYDDIALTLVNELLQTAPNDPVLVLTKAWVSNDVHAHEGYLAEHSNIINTTSNNYKSTYQPLKSTIEQLNLKTQQANTIKDKGGAINNNANVKGNAKKTLEDAEAINACKNATCS
jgi:hypothetical protein